MDTSATVHSHNQRIHSVIVDKPDSDGICIFPAMKPIQGLRKQNIEQRFSIAISSRRAWGYAMVDHVCPMKEDVDLDRTYRVFAADLMRYTTAGRKFLIDFMF